MSAARQDGPVPRTRAPLALALLVAACSTGTTAAARPPRVPEPSAAAGPVSKATLQAALLLPSQLPKAPSLQTYADPGLVRLGDPRLSLCRPIGPAAPHEVANVLAKPETPGQAVIFEVVNAYADAAAAHTAWAGDLAAATACPAYDVGGSKVRLTDLGPVAVPGPARAFHYRLRTPDVVTGDARTVAVKGAWTVVLSGYGRPADGREMLAYQAALMVKALARLPAP